MPKTADITGAKRIENTRPENVYSRRGSRVESTQPAITSIPSHTPFWSTNRARGISVKSGNRLPTAKPTNEHSKSIANSVKVIAINDSKRSCVIICIRIMKIAIEQTAGIKDVESFALRISFSFRGVIRKLRKALPSCPIPVNDR